MHLSNETRLVLVAFIFLFLFWPCLFAGMRAFSSMMVEVNKKLPEKDQIPIYGKYLAYKKLSLVRNFYKRFYPEGRLRTLHTVALTGCMISMLLVFGLIRA